MDPTTRADFFLFGATSEIAQQLFKAERAWFTQNVRKLVLVQRRPEVSEAYAGFDTVVVRADVSDARRFRQQVDELVQTHASSERLQHVFPTYGAFHLKNEPKPHFTFSDDGFQINLNCRLQIIEAFRGLHANTRFHLFGSLLGSFPYAGDYATSMWFVNQLPRHPQYADLNLRVYNLGGLKTSFWDHQAGPPNNPFVRPEIPTAWLRERLASSDRGVFDNFPTLTSRIACTLGRAGFRML